jgi:hypothetical protein
MTKPAEWVPLFKLAIKILSNEKVLKSQWSFGGGTALMTYYNHRKSKDIDIFLRDVQLLTKFTPRLNDYVADRVDDYTEMSSFLKLKVKQQEIDFIVAPFLTQKPTMKKFIGNTQVNVETPEEIVIKKVFYRAEAFKTRDVFDLAVVIKDKADGLLENISVYQNKIPVLRDRLKTLKRVYDIELKALDIIDHRIAKDALEVVLEFVDELT